MIEKLLRTIFFLALLLAIGAVHAETPEPEATDIAALRAAALAEAGKFLSLNGSGQHLEAGPIDARLRLARCGTPIRASANAGQTSHDRVLIVLNCAQPKAWQIYLPVRIVGSRAALRTRRAVVTGQVLQTADVETIDLDSELLPPGALDAGTGIGHMTAAHALAAGSILTSRDLISIRAVEKGQAILLIGKSPVLEVKMAAVALDNAFLNQRVKVRNSSSGRILEGLARAPGIVEVTLPGL
jgi:flagellar basal body P-ring formation protein FlgA